MEQDFETFAEDQEVTDELEGDALKDDAPEDDALDDDVPENDVPENDAPEVPEETAGQEPVGEAPAEAAPVATSFGTVTGRLSEIAEVMEDETMPLDDALDLLEEAVALGMQASNLLESDMEAHNAEEDDDETEAEPGETAE